MIKRVDQMERSETTKEKEVKQLKVEEDLEKL